jgi:hypothetical protein
MVKTQDLCDNTQDVTDGKVVNSEMSGRNGSENKSNVMKVCWCSTYNSLITPQTRVSVPSVTSCSQLGEYKKWYSSSGV